MSAGHVGSFGRVNGATPLAAFVVSRILFGAVDSQGRGRGEANSVRAHIRYRFDSVFARGTFPVIVLLGFATLALVVSAAIVLTVVHVTINVGGQQSEGPLEALWSAVVRTLDPGTMGQDVGWGFRVVALLVTLGGIFIVSTLIGLLTTGLDRSLDRLRKGRSAVIEADHTLILGWSSKVPAILGELATAQESEGATCVVILTRRDRGAVEDALAGVVHRKHRMRVVVRTGDPSDLNDLAIVAPCSARRIIAVSPDTVDQGDASVIRTVLALMDDRWGGRIEKIVAEFNDERHAASIERLAPELVVAVVPKTMIARIAAHVCRSHGVSDVYQDLLDFSGHEVYVDRRSDAGIPVARPMVDLLHDYSQACVIGFVDGVGKIHLAPELDRLVPAGSRLIVVSEDDSTIARGDMERARTSVVGRPVREAGPSTSARTLVLGWNELGIHLLGQMSGNGNDLRQMLVAVDEDDDSELSDRERRDFDRWGVTWVRDDIYRDDVLTRLVRDHRPERIVLLADHHGRDTAVADAEVLMRLLHVRTVTADLARPPSIVVELRDAKDVQLASIARADDLIVSDHLASLVIAQLAQDPTLHQLYGQLFSPTGPDLSTVPFEALDMPSGAVFGDVVTACAARGSYAIAVRRFMNQPDSDRPASAPAAVALIENGVARLSQLVYPAMGDPVLPSDTVVVLNPGGP